MQKHDRQGARTITEHERRFHTAAYLELGRPGSDIRLRIGVDPDSGEPYIILPGVGRKTLSWKDNGDGTFTLIGT